MECNPFTFKWPFSAFLVGPSFSGKTEWIKKLLENIDVMIQGVKCDRIVYCYGVYQPLFDVLGENPMITLFEGPPTEKDLDEVPGERKLIIIDDLCDEMKDSKFLTALFTKLAHHKNWATILITQNSFLGNRSSRVNATYLILMKNNADRLQVRTLAYQMFPEKPKYLIESYMDACSQPWGYLLIDNHMTTDPKLRLVTNIFPDKEQIFYLPR